MGEAFKAFQEYLLRLKERGVMLAVCSKNEESNAVAAFEKRPEMPLKREDFVSFKANWLPKPENILQIASELNIGIDTLVFVDDNPAEQEHVRQCLPNVKVVELWADPADYPRLLDEVEGSKPQRSGRGSGADPKVPGKCPTHALQEPPAIMALTYHRFNKRPSSGHSKKFNWNGSHSSSTRRINSTSPLCGKVGHRWRL